MQDVPHGSISIDLAARQVIKHPNSPGKFAVKKNNGKWMSFRGNGEVYEHPDALDEQELTQIGPVTGGMLYLADRTGKKDNAGEPGYLFRVYAFNV